MLLSWKQLTAVIVLFGMAQCQEFFPRIQFPFDPYRGDLTSRLGDFSAGIARSQYQYNQNQQPLPAEVKQTNRNPTNERNPNQNSNDFQFPVNEENQQGSQYPTQTFQPQLPQPRPPIPNNNAQQPNSAGEQQNSGIQTFMSGGEQFTASAPAPSKPVGSQGNLNQVWNDRRNPQRNPQSSIGASNPDAIGQSASRPSVQGQVAGQQYPQSNSVDAKKRVISGTTKFAGDVYSLLRNEFPNTSFMTSPFSVSTVLAMLQIAATGNTLTQLMEKGGLPEKSKTKEGFQQIIQSFLRQDSRGPKTNLANIVYISQKVRALNDEYKQNLARYFESNVEPVNFDNPAEATSKINDWVRTQTKNKITSVITPQEIDPNSALILISAVYFNGKWKNRFDYTLTRQEDFIRSDGRPEKSLIMSLTDNVDYYEDQTLQAKFLDLPYEGDDSSMTFILPNRPEGMEVLERNMQNILNTKRPLADTYVSVKIPKFSIESKIHFKPILNKLGITDMFRSQKDLSDIARNSPNHSRPNLSVSNVLQKTIINVTEAGTEAAAVTTAGVVLLMAPHRPQPSDIEFFATRPFLFVLKVHGIPLFIGRYSGE